MFRYPDDFPEQFDDVDVSEALRELLALKKISFTWDDDEKEFMFYMTEEQKTQHDLECGEI